MNSFELSVVQALSIAGSTFALGITLGWILALFHTGGSSGHPNRDDKEE